RAHAAPLASKEKHLMRATIALAALVLSLAPLLLGAAAPPSPRVVPGDAHDLVLFHKSRPYLVRLHLQAGGRAYAADWNSTVEHLFRFLDNDGNGTLSKVEARHAPSVTQWAQMLQGAEIDPDAAPAYEALGGP